ncbi:hypothetical protein J6590_022651 [Homalodisca vitripennis]|nr:hypothetical protein J6590_022651 [Homalodisca vitripennis]
MKRIVSENNKILPDDLFLYSYWRSSSLNVNDQEPTLVPIKPTKYVLVVRKRPEDCLRQSQLLPYFLRLMFITASGFTAHCKREMYSARTDLIVLSGAEVWKMDGENGGSKRSHARSSSVGQELISLCCREQESGRWMVETEVVNDLMQAQGLISLCCWEQESGGWMAEADVENDLVARADLIVLSGAGVCEMYGGGGCFERFRVRFSSVAQGLISLCCRELEFGTWMAEADVLNDFVADLIVLSGAGVCEMDGGGGGCDVGLFLSQSVAARQTITVCMVTACKQTSASARLHFHLENYCFHHLVTNVIIFMFAVFLLNKQTCKHRNFVENRKNISGRSRPKSQQKRFVRMHDAFTPLLRMAALPVSDAPTLTSLVLHFLLHVDYVYFCLHSFPPLPPAHRCRPTSGLSPGHAPPSPLAVHVPYRQRTWSRRQVN